MKFRQVMLSMAMAASLACILAACGSSGTSNTAGDSTQDSTGVEEAAVQEELDAAAELEQKPYEGHELRNADDLYAIAEDAIALAQTKQEEAESANADADDGDNIDPDASMASNDFNNGNDSYRSGDYENAVTFYESALNRDPVHYGANVNLALARLQLEQNEEALLQALTCVYLFPDDPGCLLNAQVAATACGFGVSDIHNSLDVVLQSAGDYNFVDVLINNTDATEVKGACAYNDVWNEIETDLYISMQESDQAGRTKYEEIRDSLQTISDSYGSDPDIEQLQAYLEIVGEQLGYGAEGTAGDDTATADAAATGSAVKDLTQGDAQSQSSGSKDAEGSNGSDDSSGSVLQTIAG